ncbi:MAG: DNA topoisomerase 3 [Sporomusaceae bacterium]|nr:DNA topoisomerase 3 [Sporomusaceae bacterium]
MKLYIAEKPSMALELAKCLPGPLRRLDGYFITGDGTVTWAYGHILRQAEPGEYDVKYERWRMEDLPIIPQEWQLLIEKSCEKQFGVIARLLGEATEIIHAGDPDREGQLLIDEILDYVHNEKPVKRVLLNALDEQSIKKALRNLKENQAFFNLKQSALARARADWLIGMNLSRAYTLAAQWAGHKLTLPVGRVKTPTLALVVRREREIKDFKPIDYYNIKADFGHLKGGFTAQFRPSDEQLGLDSENRLVDKREAEKLLAKFVQNKTIETAEITRYETTEKKESPRLPLSLSALQVLAGKKFGYDPQAVLDGAQKLYEKKLTSYPRSDCDFLPESQLEDVPVILANLKETGASLLAQWAQDADASLKSRAWNDKKITAHHAIIPTQEKANLVKLSKIEQDLYFLIAQAYLAQFYPIHRYKQTKVEVSYCDELFTASGRTIIDMGWKALYSADEKNSGEEENQAGGDEADKASDLLPPMKQGDTADFLAASLEQKETKPPSRFTAATLLAAMKEIHRFVKQAELKKQLKEVAGIGTEATRATIIQELGQRGFLKPEGKKKYLIPTDRAYLLIDMLPDELTYPDSTALWEEKLQQMSQGEGTLGDFLQKQSQFMTLLCQKAVKVSPPLAGAHPCPVCGQGVLQQRQGKNGVFWGCSRYPACRATYDDADGQPQKPLYPCPRCKQGSLQLRQGKNGPFWGCNRFPQCREAYDDVDGKPRGYKNS